MTSGTLEGPVTPHEREALDLESQAEKMRQVGRRRTAAVLEWLAQRRRALWWTQQEPPWTAARPKPRASSHNHSPIVAP